MPPPRPDLKLIRRFRFVVSSNWARHASIWVTMSKDMRSGSSRGLGTYSIILPTPARRPTMNRAAPGVTRMDYPALRRQNLLGRLAAEELDAYLITNPVNVTYLTGFSGESSYLLFGRDRTVLVSDSRFTEQLAEECPSLDVHIR